MIKLKKNEIYDKTKKNETFEFQISQKITGSKFQYRFQTRKFGVIVAFFKLYEKFFIPVKIVN